MVRLLWIVLRFTFNAWVGAATLFVVTGVREVTSPLFDASTKNQLASLRFPAFYAFGFTLVLLGFISSVFLWFLQSDRRRGLGAIVALGVAALATMAFDYLHIYLPLDDLMAKPDARGLPEFQKLHEWSKYINFASLLLILIASGIANLEPKRLTPTEGNRA